MARASYVIRDGKLVPKHMATPLQHRGPRSGLPRPHVISDTIELRHPSNGKIYQSKKAFRDETRARGLTEMGNEAFPAERVPTDAEVAREVAGDIAEAYDAIENGADVRAAGSLEDSAIPNKDAVINASGAG